MNFYLRQIQIHIFILFFIPQYMGLGESVESFVIWNSGYGGWSTWINLKECRHYDLGGNALKFKKDLLRNCLYQKNFFYFTETDQYHLNLSSLFKKTMSPHCPHLLNHFNTYKNFSNLDPEQCPLQIKSNWCIPLVGFQTQSHSKKPLLNPLCQKLLILPGHGSKKYFSKNNVRDFLKYKMLVTSTQARTSKQDFKTENLFKKHRRKLIYIHVWGHLILQI